MVADNLTSSDRVFHALSDPTRRDILRRTAGQALSVSALARSYPISFAAVHKHVAVLEAAGLVSKSKRGREQLVHAELTSFDAIRAELNALESLWVGRIDRMGELLALETRERDDGGH